MAYPSRIGSPQVKAAAVAVVNLQAENGTTTVRNTVARTGGRWSSIQCIEDAVFTKLTCPQNEGGSLDNITMVKGQNLSLGIITEVTLASGGVVLSKI